ncbi:chloride channel protein [bacterium]|nr:chloride channel protein [bacterium]MBU1073315.1 chloride channel protein [bacterium]MBU1675599.1 chloride channel protein [bacterium]
MRDRINAFLFRLRPGVYGADHSAMVPIAAAVGLLGGLCAVGFREFIAFVQTQTWRVDAFTLDGVRAHPWWWIVAAPAAGGLVVGLIIRLFAREAKGHGVPEVIEAVMLRGGRIRPRVVIAKMIASGVCIGTGGSVGREGPIVQIGASLGSAIGQWLHMGERRIRTLVGCGAAAGIAGTFNAPIAGVLFAAEVILGDFALTSLTPIVISSVAATVVCHHFLGNVPAFVIPAYTLVSPNELFAYAFLGIVAGLVALLFVRVLYGMEDFWDGPLGRIPGPARALLGGAVIGAIALRYPEIMGVGYEAIEMALREQLVWSTLLILAGVKIFAVSTTIGSGGSGGVFAPSLFIGSMLGGSVGGAVHTFWPALTATPGAYALVGMGAVVAATTHAPITAFMIIFELTSDYKIILPLMITCVLATLIATRLSDASIYSMKLIRRGIDMYRGKSLNVLHHLKVRDVMREPGTTVSPDTHLLSLLSVFMTNPTDTFFVVDGTGRLLGVINIDDLRPLMQDPETLDSVLIAYDIMREREFPAVGPEDGLDEVMRQLGRYRFAVPVLAEGRLVGTIWPEDVINRYNAEVFKRDMATSMATSVENTGRFTKLPGVSGLSIAEIPVPAAFVGRSCAELDIRNRLGVTLLLVKRREGDDHAIAERIPDAELVFDAGDIVLALGPPERLRRLENML